MIKFLLYAAVIIVAIITVNKLDWSFDEWCIFVSVLFALRLIHLAFKRPSGSWLNSLNNFASNISGEEITWWDTRATVASEDYTSGVWWWVLYKWVITILGALAAIYLTFKGVVWLFSQKIFWIIVGAIVGLQFLVCIVIVLIEQAKEKRKREKAEKEKAFQAQCASLADEFINTANIPMTSQAVNHDNYEYCENALREIKNMIESLNATEDVAVSKRALADKKLEFFYNVSLYAQAQELFKTSPEDEVKLREVFNIAIESNDYNVLRNHSFNCGNDYDLFNNELDEQKALLDDDRLAPYLKKLKEKESLDTAGFLGLTSSSKLAEKAQALNTLYEDAVAEYSELDTVREKINYILDKQRVCAYERLYLGVELINYIRSNAGGKGLTKADGLVEMNLDLGVVDVSNVGEADVVGIALNVFSNYAGNKNFVSYAIVNPKEAAGKAGLEILGNVLKARKESIDASNEVISQVVTQLPKIVDDYTACQAQLLRAIELIKALINANRGFEKIYFPLYEKVFVNDDVSSVSLKDVQLLAGAIKEFNTIAKSQL